MRYDFRKKGEDAQWAETHDTKVVRASPKLMLFVGQRVEVLLMWCQARRFKAYVSESAGAAVRKMEEPLWG